MVDININQHPSRSDAIDFTVLRHPFTQYRIGSGVGYRVGMGWDGELVTCPHPQLAERSLRGKNIKYLRKLK